MMARTFSSPVFAQSKTPMSIGFAHVPSALRHVANTWSLFFAFPSWPSSCRMMRYSFRTYPVESFVTLPVAVKSSTVRSEAKISAVSRIRCIEDSDGAINDANAACFNGVRSSQPSVTVSMSAKYAMATSSGLELLDELAIT